VGGDGVDQLRWRKPRPPGFGSDRRNGEPEPILTESEYLHELSRGMTPVAVHLRSGEVLRGVIEYYDRRFIRLTRKGEPNLFIFKQEIKYLCEE
jgi:host factor-I protein